MRTVALVTLLIATICAFGIPQSTPNEYKLRILSVLTSNFIIVNTAHYSTSNHVSLDSPATLQIFYENEKLDSYEITAVKGSIKISTKRNWKDSPDYVPQLVDSVGFVRDEAVFAVKNN